MKPVLAFLLALLIMCILASASLAEPAVPEDLVGLWSGTGTTGAKGSPIDLSFTVNQDGTGEYLFIQGGYTETYPFTMQSKTSSFTVSVPENNALGISSVAGTYEITDGVMTLAIVTRFQNGGTYEYTAECTKQETASEGDLPPFAWQDKTMRLALITEDEAVIAYNTAGSQDPRGEDGRFIKLMFVADGDPLTSDEMNALGSAAKLRTADSTYYSTSIFTNIRITITDGKFSLSDSQPSFGLLYVVPKTVALQSLRLEITDTDTVYSLMPYGEENYQPESTEAPQ